MNSKKIAVLVVIAVVMATAAGYLITVYAQEPGNNTTSTAIQVFSTGKVPFNEHKGAWKGAFRGSAAWSVEISQEYNSTVMSVLMSNSETAQLLSQGFSVIGVKPLVKAYVAGNGDVTLKATQAVVMLTNNTAIYAYSVDIEKNTVTLLAYHLVPVTPNCRCPCK